MPRRPRVLLALVLFVAPACTKANKAGTETPELRAPAAISDLDDFAEARNAYALMALDDPARAKLRADLRDYLIGYIDEALGEEREDAAVTGLEQIAQLWVARELRAPAPDPAIAAVATRVYEQVAPSGDERPAMLALALQQAFGDAGQREAAEAGYAQLIDWIERSEGFSGDPHFGDLDRLLEDVSGILPTPFVVDELAGVYLARYRAAQTGAGGLSGSRDPRVPFTAYLLARLYLRADDLDAAVAAIDRVEADETTRDLRDLIADAAEGGRSPADLDQLAREFVPSPDNKLPEEILRQSWGIVDNLSRRVLARFPDDPPAHLSRGRVLRARGLNEAAIIHYERAFAGKTRATDREDLHQAWSELAGLYQLVLEDRSADEEVDAKALQAMLERVEAFHRRAAETWPQRPIEPGLPLAWMTVALDEFDAGHIDRAEALLQQTLAAEPHPLALSLLGTIAMRRGQLDEARSTLARIPELSYLDQLERYDWQIRASLQLAEVELLAGHEQAGEEHLRGSLRQLNTLLSYPGLSNPLRVEFAGRRALVFFYLGEIDLAMKDFREAHAHGGGSVYAQTLMFAVVHGLLPQAREILAAAIESEVVGPELLVYFALWVNDLSRRTTGAGDELAEAHLSSFAADKGNDKWIRKLARHGLGELEGKALIGAADAPRERSEAYFYEALRRWRSGSHKDGLALLAKVIDVELLGDFEFQMAQSYLKWNELPKTARAAIPSTN